MREIILDTETTGLDFKSGDRIIEVACVELANHIETGSILQFYCSTEKTINEGANKIHGLTNEFLNKHPTFKQQSGKLLDFIKNDTLIIHNADFDIGFVNNELKLAGSQPIKNKVVDTVKLARKILNTKIANLDYLCKRLSIDLSKRTYHGALLDCRLLAGVYLELLGGKQTILDLDNKTTNEIKNTDKKVYKYNKIYKINLSVNDIKEHKEFIADLKNALWHKVKY